MFNFLTGKKQQIEIISKIYIKKDEKDELFNILTYAVKTILSIYNIL